jgi:hypothetical protein
MAVTAFSYLVDWDQLMDAKKNGRLIEAFIQALENKQPWLEAYSSPNWNSNWHQYVEGEDAYEQLRKHLRPEITTKLDQLAKAFWWKLEDIAINDLGCDPESEEHAQQFSINANPSTVEYLLSLWSQVNPNELIQVFDQSVNVPANSYITSGAAFISRVLMWISLLNAASAKKRGIVVTIA